MRHKLQAGLPLNSEATTRDLSCLIWLNAFQEFNVFPQGSHDPDSLPGSEATKVLQCIESKTDLDKSTNSNSCN
jgi:hypothetical protein